MKLVVLGAGGQVGSAVCRLARSRVIPCLGYRRPDADLTDPRAVARAVRGASVVVNAAAFTGVDQAEAEPAAAFAVNRDGAGIAAAACAAAGAMLLHLSTDHVFDGTCERPYREGDPVQPTGTYGASKAAGETLVRERCERHVILRTGWVFAPGDDGFTTRMRRLAEQPGPVAGNRRGGPTAAADVAEALLRLAAGLARAERPAWGTYHFCGAPAVSHSEFAAAALAGQPRPRLLPADTESPPAAAEPWPATVLDCDLIRRRFAIRQPDWRRSLAMLPGATARRGAA